ncbi:glycosyltransferase [bacterium]|nr:glycosyltransferase [bacterium]
MSVSRLAVVFDNTLRPETTGTYCRRALGKLVEVEHLLPSALPHISPQRYDAFLFVDDGTEYEIPEACRPRLWWAIDTHLEFERCFQRAQDCDLVFAAQRAGAERLKHQGISTAIWLPLACDPDIHRRHSVPLAWDWCFVGHLFPGPRTELIELLRQQFPQAFVGQKYFEAMAETYSASRLVFNRSLADDLNMRVFEALACGSLLMTNDLADHGQAELFQAGQHLVTYHSADELLERCAYYLKHDDERERIAAAGQALVQTQHTYRHRMQTILSAWAALRSRTARTVTPTPPKDASYFGWERPEVLALIPPSARAVLDLGCGSGRMGAALNRRQPCTVWGVERHPAAADQARSRLDQVVTADVETLSQLPPEAPPFDAIVCADLLEHLREPRALLERCRTWLSPEGVVIASLPNVQHHSVVTGLLDGNFTYEPAGLLDDDHLRLFTRREIEKLFFRAGYQGLQWQTVPGTGHAEWVVQGRPGTVQIGGLQISGLSSTAAEGFFAYQYLVVAHTRLRPTDALTSIILVAHNQLHYTRQCLESLRFRTDEPYELIVVDNGSTDGTVDYLRGQADLRLIENAENRGFPAAVNQGLAIAQGQQLLLLNNDTIVTTGWLRRLLDALHRDPQVGLVGPVSNQVSGPQQITVPYRDLASLDGFAWEWGQQHAGQLQELERLVGFCLLFRREVLEQIGGLDERFGIGNFEDDDYCRRARLAGFRTVVAVDSFVHHFGGRTFVGAGIDFAALMQANERLYRDKWSGSAPSSSATPPSEFRLGLAPEGGLQLQRRSRVSLCMIVRNNADTIGPCLESIRPWVDEMLVLDTGSTDATPALCESLGARVRHWPWRDDFSAARNESLRDAQGDWVFWMDSDDTIPPDCGQRLRALVDSPHPDGVLGYVMQVHCPGPGSTGQHDVTVVDHIKLFRNRPDLRFEHRIHEQILPAIRRAGGEVQFTDIYVVHSGSDHSAVGRERKLERDFKLLHLDLQERPDHPFVLFNLGMTHADVQDHDTAAHWLERCLEVSRPQESHVRKAYALLVSVRYQQLRYADAFATCQRARADYPDDKELLFRQAMLQHQFGRLDEAVQSYQEVLAPPATRHFASVDAGLATYKARHNLALVYEDLHAWDQALSTWQEILTVHPNYQPALQAIQRLHNDLRSGR